MKHFPLLRHSWPFVDSGRTLNLFSVFVQILIVSCSIIPEEAILKEEELDGLKLNTFELIQQKAGSPQQTATARLLYDSAVNIVVNSTTTVKRRVRFTMPVFPDLMLKYRSGTKATNLQLRISYLKDDVPYSVVLFQGDSAVEVYIFHYTTAGKLSQFVTILNPVDNKPLQLLTRDTLIYEGEKLKTIRRRSPDANLAGNFDEILTSPLDSDYLDLTSTKFEHPQYSIRLDNQSNCQGSIASSCTTLTRHLQWKTGNQQNETGSLITNHNSFANKILGLQLIVDARSDCCRWDTYYFHPFFMLRDNLKFGNVLFSVYSIDWFDPGDKFTGGGNFDQSVNIQFHYVP